MRYFAVIKSQFVGLHIALATLCPNHSNAENADVVGKTTVYIETQVAPGKIEYGTGFILADERGACIVTAQHVAAKSNPSTRIRLLVGNNDQSIFLNDLVAKKPFAWENNEKADVSAIKIVSPQNGPLHVFRRIQLFPANELPPRDRPIMIFGFPLAIGSSTLAPVSMRFNRASDIFVGKSDGFPVESEYFALDKPITQGFSGSPAFLVPGNFPRDSSIVVVKNFALVGLAAATASDNTGGKLGMVVPSKYVAETFDKAVEK